MRGPLIVFYDVSLDVRRDAVRAALRPLGDWHQRSVWICGPAHDLTVESLFTGLATLIEPADRLRVVEPCTACRQQVLWTPHARRPWPDAGQW